MLRALGLLKLKKIRPVDAAAKKGGIFKTKAIRYLKCGFPWASKNQIETCAFFRLPGKNREWSASPGASQQGNSSNGPRSPRLPHPHPTPAPEQEEEADCVLRTAQLVAITHTIKSQRGGQLCPPAAPVWSPCQSWRPNQFQLGPGTVGPAAS